MNALSRLWEKLAHSKKYRESFTGSVVKRMIPLQIRVLRNQRDWSQAQLATQAQISQGVISRAEDPEYGNLTINTLVRIAAGFDCAFVGRFVPYSELGRWYTRLDDEKSLEVPSFAEDRPEGLHIERVALDARKSRVFTPVISMARMHRATAEPIVESAHGTSQASGELIERKPFGIAVTHAATMPMSASVAQIGATAEARA